MSANQQQSNPPTGATEQSLAPSAGSTRLLPFDVIVWDDAQNKEVTLGIVWLKIPETGLWGWDDVAYCEKEAAEILRDNLTCSTSVFGLRQGSNAEVSGSESAAPTVQPTTATAP